MEARRPIRARQRQEHVSGRAGRKGTAVPRPPVESQVGETLGLTAVAACGPAVAGWVHWCHSRSRGRLGPVRRGRQHLGQAALGSAPGVVGRQAAGSAAPGGSPPRAAGRWWGGTGARVRIRRGFWQRHYQSKTLSANPRLSDIQHIPIPPCPLTSPSTMACPSTACTACSADSCSACPCTTTSTGCAA